VRGPRKLARRHTVSSGVVMVSRVVEAKAADRAAVAAVRAAVDRPVADGTVADRSAVVVDERRTDDGLVTVRSGSS